MRTILCILAAVLYLAGIGIADDMDTYNIPGDENYIYIRVSAKMTDENGRVSKGAGGFSTLETNFGRVSFTFPDTLSDFGIAAPGATALPVFRITETGKYRTVAEDIWLMVDVYLYPRITNDGQIRLTGLATEMKRVPGCTPAAFGYKETRVDVTVPDGRWGPLPVTAKIRDLKITFEVEAEATTKLTYRRSTQRFVDFDIDYALINADDKRVEIDNSGCHLGMPATSEFGGGSCTQRRVFHLPDGTTLLYYSIQTIKNVTWNADSTISFDLQVKQAHVRNPSDTLAAYDEIQSSQKAETVFSRTITTTPGEQNVVEIPMIRNHPLPFEGGEEIVIKNTVTAQDL
jgi:hypothetical protein